MENPFTVSFAPVKLSIPLAPYANLDQKQIEAVCKFAKLSKPIRAICWWRVGTGKTRIALALALKDIQIRRELQHDSTKVRKSCWPWVCIIVAKPGAMYDWQEEIKRIGCDALFTTDPNVVSFKRPTFLFVSYASLASLQRKLESNSWIRFVIADEFYLYSNWKSKRAMALRQIVGEKLGVIGLAGTIITTQDNSQVWGQALSLGIHGRLARNLTQFRSLYQIHFNANYGHGSVMRFKNAPNWKEKALARLQKHIHIHFPPVLQRCVEQVQFYPLTKQQKELIHDLETNYFLEWKDREFDLSYSFQVLNKVRGILNGWIQTEEKVFDYLPCAKRDSLLSDVHELHGAGEPCVIWCAFRADVEMLSSMLEVASLQMVGGKPFDLSSFQSGKCRIVLATLGSGASVNHFRDVPYAKFFSLNYKRLDLQQSKGRHTRRDSKIDAVYYKYYEGANSYEGDLRKHLLETDSHENQIIQTWHRQLLSTRKKKFNLSGVF